MTQYPHERREEPVGFHFAVSKIQFWISLLGLLTVLGLSPPFVAKLMVERSIHMIVDQVMDRHNHDPGAHLEALSRQYQVSHEADEKIQNQLNRIESKLDDALQRIAMLEGAGGKGRP